MIFATSWIGTLPGWLTVASIAIAAWLLYRGGSSTAIEGLQATNRELERQIADLRKESNAQKQTIAELTARTDVTIALAPVISAMSTHEDRAEKRSHAIIAILQQVADRLGRDEEAA